MPDERHQSTDPYEVLGVARSATADEIRRAFRDGAKRHHPDLNPGDRAAEERFKALSAANELLSDPDRRARFDRGEIDAAGQPRAPERPRYRDYAEAATGARYGAGRAGPGAGMPGGGGTPGEGMPGGTDEEWGDIFSDLFRERDAGRGPARPRRGADERYALAIGLLDTLRGATRRLTLPDGRVLDVAVPVGIEDGQTLRLRGRGAPGRDGGPDGDALIALHVEPHPVFRRDGADLRVELPVTLREAVLGARVTAPTPTGPVSMTVPPRSDSGRTLRLRGRGVPAHGTVAAGDLYVALQVRLVDADDALAAFLEGWTSANAVDPRVAVLEEARS